MQPLYDFIASATPRLNVKIVGATAAIIEVTRVPLACMFQDTMYYYRNGMHSTHHYLDLFILVTVH